MSATIAADWVATSVHEGCDECARCAEEAIVYARVTGSVGATYEVVSGDHPEVVVHGATVTREARS